MSNLKNMVSQIVLYCVYYYRNYYGYSQTKFETNAVF